MNTYKILIAEKDLLARQAISRVLKRNSHFNVIAHSPRGAKLDSLIEDFNPDVVLLNLDDRNSEDFELFTKLRVRYPKLPVVVLSPRDEEGAKAAITAITMGAVDVVTKPGNCNNLLFANRHLSKRLIPIVEVAAQRSETGKTPTDKTPAGSFSKQAEGEHETQNFKNIERRESEIITIGGCCGGPEALFNLITKLPRDLSVPVVVVQHFPKIYTKVLADELDKRSRLKVKEVFDGAELSPGVVWIAPGGYHTEIHRNGTKIHLRIHRGPRELGDRPSINVLFRSAVRAYGEKTLAVILSGIGKDGVSGAEAIRLAGGQVLVQKPVTSVASEMPLNIMRAGLTEQSFAIEQLTEEILNRIPENITNSHTHSIESSKSTRPSSIKPTNLSNMMEFSSL